MRKLLLFLLLSVFAGPSYAGDLCATAKEALVSAQKIRGLQKKQSVPCLVRDKKKIKNYVIEAVQEDTPKQRLVGEGLLFRALGLVPETFEYEKELIDLYTSQIGGYYDPKRDHFIMAAWIPAALQYPVAVHELVHALQDQYFDLATFVDATSMTSDALMARSALVEGDATAVMIDYSMQLSGAGRLADQANTNMFLAQNVIGSQMLGGIENAPRSLLTLIIFPYSSGLRFAHALLREGKGYDALNSAFKKPPRSTEEILHPEKYGSTAPEFEVLEIEDAGRNRIHEDTMGEFFVSVWLNSQGVEGSEAALASAGWGGDTIAVFDAGDAGHIVEWKLRFDTVMDTNEFAAVLKKRKGDRGDFHCEEQLCTGIFTLAQ